MSQPAYIYSDLPSTDPEVPAFEGRDVSYIVIRISGLGKVQTADPKLFTIDDMVRLIVEARCIGVFHREDSKGDLYREQVLVPKEIDTCPWDPANPNDDGIIRAPRP